MQISVARVNGFCPVIRFQKRILRMFCGVWGVNSYSKNAFYSLLKYRIVMEVGSAKLMGQSKAFSIVCSGFRSCSGEDSFRCLAQIASGEGVEKEQQKLLLFNRTGRVVARLWADFKNV